ncbi:hypothetical protein [Deinococcus aquatilis]|uniref:hypothetical protein n=1 Tax=Deinococcus aquatilis TaxID=519440 RepID=UPI0003A68DE3|nr:hypothetical protein [Deinococcus aquatilis]
MSLPNSECQRLLDAISEQQPQATDDGHSDLSLTLTAQHHGFPTLARPALFHLLHVYLGVPALHTPRSELIASFGFLRQLTRDRLQYPHATDIELYLAPPPHGRCLFVTLPAGHPSAHLLTRTLPPEGKRLGHTLVYGLSAAPALQEWATAHRIPLPFTPADVQAARERCGGTVTFTMQAHHFDHANDVLIQGYSSSDLDRLRDTIHFPCRQPRPDRWEYFTAIALTDVLELAFQHALDLRVRGPELGTPPRLIAAAPHHRISFAAFLQQVWAPIQDSSRHLHDPHPPYKGSNDPHPTPAQPLH